jgi:redox-regulated HSP33 family molecular chaperone
MNIRAHRTHPVRALTLTALLGAMLKDAGGQLTMQAQTESGIIDLLVCDYRAGELRGYVRFDKDRLVGMPSLPTLEMLFGKGYLAITFDQTATASATRASVPLEGASLAEAAQSFFAQSEQIPSWCACGGRYRPRRGGLLLQHLHEGEEGRERLHTPARSSRMGSMCARWRRRSAAMSWSMSISRSRLCCGACSTRRKCASLPAWRWRAAAGAAPSI